MGVIVGYGDGHGEMCVCGMDTLLLIVICELET